MPVLMEFGLRDFSLEAVYLAKGVVARDAMNGLKTVRTRFMRSWRLLWRYCPGV
jgi:hypothetical protein